MQRFLSPMLALAVVCVLPLAGGCEKKSSPRMPPPTNNPAPQPQAQPTPAPGGIPAEFTTLIDANWPRIDAEGKAFLEKFEVASKARNSGDRAALTKAIEEARQHYNEAKDLWAEIAYWPVNALDDGKITQSVADLCESHLRVKSATVKGWDKKAKGLKELSTVR